MRRFGRFIILAAIGFALGAGFAYFQGVQEAKNAATQQQVVPGDVSQGEEPLKVIGMETPAAEVPAENAMSGSAEDVAPAAPVVEEEQAVAGSAVGGAFSLTDHNGQPVTEKSWPGKYKLVFFGFTNCPDICPTTLDKLTTALNALGADAEKLQPLFVTTDPARDTAETLKTYLGGYHATILGLTGTEEQVKAAEDTYKVYAAKVPGADSSTYTMDHSAYVFLMSPDDQMLEIFKKDDTAEAIVEKVRARVATPAAETPALAPAEAPPAETVPAATP